MNRLPAVPTSPLRAALLAALLAPLLAISTPGAALAETLAKPALDRLVASQSAKPPASFNAFLAAAVKAEPKLAPAVRAYRAKRPLKGDDLVNIGRLLGVYNRLHNEAAVLDSITEMVAIRTVRDERVPQHENPAIIAFGKVVERMARDFGLTYRNVDNRVFEVTLPGTGADTFGILTHADVVPVVADEWVLDDGTRLDPFKVTRVGDYLYGRGTIDDKGSIAAALYAMKTVRRERRAAGPHDPADDRNHRGNRRRRHEVLPGPHHAARVQHRAGQQVPGGGGREGLGCADRAFRRPADGRQGARHRGHGRRGLRQRDSADRHGAHHGR